MSLVEALSFRQVTEEVVGAKPPLTFRSTIYWGQSGLVVVNEWGISEDVARAAAQLKMDLKIQQLMALVR